MDSKVLGGLTDRRGFLNTACFLALAGSVGDKGPGGASSPSKPQTPASRGGAAPPETPAGPALPAKSGGSTTKSLEVEPGFYYDLRLPEPDGVPQGARWVGRRLVRPGAGQSFSFPLEPMYRKRFIIKLDDLATWSLADFQQFAAVIERHDAKADLGIIPGTCGPEVFAWVRSLDPQRFEIWNHTWDHGRSGPNHYEQPYDVQYRNIDRGQQLVKKETGITMRAWGGGGIRHRGQGVHDQDDVTHLAVRNHPDLVVHFHASHRFADRGYGRINSDGIFMPWRFSWFENEAYAEDGGIIDPNFVKMIQQRYPDEDPRRPMPLGNAKELIWRLEHPFWNMPEKGEMDSMVAQFHPGLWTVARRQGPYAWTPAQALGSLEALLEHIRQGKTWRFANGYETYRWERDRDRIALEKTAPDRYRLEAHRLQYPHRLELNLPANTVVEAHAYHVGAFAFEP